MTPDILSHSGAVRFIIRSFNNSHFDELIPNVPHFLQSVRLDRYHFIENFLYRRARQSPLFAHYLFWAARCDRTDPKAFPDTLLSSLELEEASLHISEAALIDLLSDLGRRILESPSDKRAFCLSGELSRIHITPDLRVPSDPESRITKINVDRSKIIPSETGFQILVSFSSPKGSVNCIFKSGIDVRPEELMIHFITKLQRIFREAGLPASMRPYRAFSTGDQRGVVECIEKLAPIEAVVLNGFDKKELWHFVVSAAPYSLLCFLFGVKKVSVFVDENGYVVCKDFGGLFETWGKVRMMEILGGGKDAPVFQEFVKLFVRCFLAVRERYEEINAILETMQRLGGRLFTRMC